MKRGDIYRTHKPEGDPKRHRICVIVSRQALIDSTFSTVVCAPVFSSGEGISTQVAVGLDEGMKHESSIHCDELVSLQKSALTDYVGALSPEKIEELNKALGIALDIPD